MTEKFEVDVTESSFSSWLQANKKRTVIISIFLFSIIVFVTLPIWFGIYIILFMSNSDPWDVFVKILDLTFAIKQGLPNLPAGVVVAVTHIIPVFVALAGKESNLRQGRLIPKFIARMIGLYLLCVGILSIVSLILFPARYEQIIGSIPKVDSIILSSSQYGLSLIGVYFATTLGLSVLFPGLKNAKIVAGSGGGG